MASNIGGTATLIGDPPNIMIGSAAHLTFMDFLAFNGPAIVVIMVVAIAIFYVMYGRNMGSLRRTASIHHGAPCTRGHQEQVALQ